MILARIFSKIFKEGGIILVDSKGQKYICGNPKKENPITLKLLKENLNWKLLLDPELEFPEAYMRNEIIIENATMKEFLMDLVRNLGRNEITAAGAIIKRFYQAYRTFTNFNLVGKSKKMLNTIMTLEGLVVKNCMTCFLIKNIVYTHVLIGKKEQRRLKKLNKIKSII